MKNIVRILIVLCVFLTGSNVLGATKVFEYGFEDWTGGMDTTPGYPFTSGYAGYMDQHAAGSEVITSYNANEMGQIWTAHSGSYFLIQNDSSSYALSPSVPGVTGGSVNLHNNVGYDGTYGGQSDFDLDEEITTGELFISFWARNNRGWRTIESGGRCKWIRVYANTHATNDTIYMHLSTGSVSPKMYFYCSGEAGAWIPSEAGPTLTNAYDGNWSSYAQDSARYDGCEYLYINYTKPTNAFNSSSWKIKDTLINNLSHSPLSVSGYNIKANNIRITDNYANNENCTGGGISFSNFLTSIEGNSNIITNLEITNNIDTTYEWGLSSVLYIGVNNSVIISNATISDNICHSGYGGAISLTAGNLTLINSIVHGNYPYPAYIREDSTYGPSEFIVQNCLFTNGQEDIQFTGNNNFEWLTGNTSGDPEFQEEGADWRYNFLSSSPCIDSGTLDLPEDIELPEFDIAGNPRIYGDGIDMGAYEWQGVGIDNEELIINNYKMKNYPNPFNPSTTISFSLLSTNNVELSIYNVKGQKVKTLFNEEMQLGKHSIIWSGVDDNNKPVGSGIYFYKLKTNKKISVKRMLLLK